MLEFEIRYNEHFITEMIIPFGEEPPYQTDTGFRFPVPVGYFDLDLSYSGCSGYELITDDNGKTRREKNEIKISQIINVKKDMVIKFSFDGTRLTEKGAFNNENVTLEDINKKLENLEQFLKDKEGTP